MSPCPTPEPTIASTANHRFAGGRRDHKQRQPDRECGEARQLRGQRAQPCAPSCASADVAIINANAAAARRGEVAPLTTLATYFRPLYKS